MKYNQIALDCVRLFSAVDSVGSFDEITGIFFRRMGIIGICPLQFFFSVLKDIGRV